MTREEFEARYAAGKRDFRNANMTGANMRGANMSGADMTGAGIICGGQRSDGYIFLARREKTIRVQAGCRDFPTFAAAREHWTATRGGTPLGDESLAIVDHLERMAKIAGWFDAGPSINAGIEQAFADAAEIGEGDQERE